MDHAQAIALYRPTLQSIAMRMLGSIADAEDIVHDTFLKWMTIDKSHIQNTKAFLIRSVTNNCINFLKKVKRAPQTLEEDHELIIDESVAVVNKDDEHHIRQAWSVLNAKLAPVERAVYVLREGFNFEYEDLQHIVDRSSDNCRQLFKRAKDKISQEVPRISIELPSIKIPDTFKNACNLGYISELIAELKVDLPLKRNFF